MTYGLCQIVSGSGYRIKPQRVSHLSFLLLIVKSRELYTTNDKIPKMYIYDMSKLEVLLGHFTHNKRGKASTFGIRVFHLMSPSTRPCTVPVLNLSPSDKTGHEN